LRLTNPIAKESRATQLQIAVYNIKSTTMDMPWGYTSTSFLMDANRSPDDLAQELERMNFPSLETSNAVDGTSRATSWACIDVLDMIDASGNLPLRDEESVADKLTKMTVSPPAPDNDADKDRSSEIGRSDAERSKPLKKGQRMQFLKASERRRLFFNVRPQQLRLQTNH
jgi:hypothetical protein